VTKHYEVSADVSFIAYVDADNATEAEEKGDELIAAAWDVANGALFKARDTIGADMSGRYDETTVTEVDEDGVPVIT
jgi:hypothetical protein